MKLFANDNSFTFILLGVKHEGWGDRAEFVDRILPEVIKEMGRAD